jgi:hypothetical protein
MHGLTRADLTPAGRTGDGSGGCRQREILGHPPLRSGIGPHARIASRAAVVHTISKRDLPRMCVRRNPRKG